MYQPVENFVKLFVFSSMGRSQGWVSYTGSTPVRSTISLHPDILAVGCPDIRIRRYEMLTPQEQPRDLRGRFASVHRIPFDSDSYRYRAAYRRLHREEVLQDAAVLARYREAGRLAQQRYRQRKKYEKEKPI